MLELYPFQEEFINGMNASFRRGNRRVLGNGMTGFGKTVVGSEAARRAIAKKNVPCVLAYREEILEQFQQSLADRRIFPGMIVPGNHPMTHYECYLGMVETFNRRVKKEPEFTKRHGINFMIADEVHIGNFSKVIDNFGGHVLGFTATPKSTGNPELNQMFDDIVLGANVQELIKYGRLVNGKTFSVDHDFSNVKKKGGEFDESFLLKEFKKAKLYDGAVSNYMRICPTRKAICYCVNIEHGLDTVMQFKEAGVRHLYYIDSKGCFHLVGGELVTIERKDLIRDFKRHKHAVLVNIGVATTGFDDPSVTCIICNYATMSIVKYHQCIGRGARACDEVWYNGIPQAKTDFIIIDMGMNWVRHMEYGRIVDWESIFRDPKKHRAQKAERRKDVRECEDCGFLMPIRSKFCGTCGMIFTEKEIEQAVLKNATAEEIKEYRLNTLPLDLRKPTGSMDLTELQAFGHHMGYKPGWAWYQYNRSWEKEKK